MTVRMIPFDFWKNKFLPFSGNPRQRIFFEIQNFKFHRLRQFSIFLTGPVLNERYCNFAHNYCRWFFDFDPGDRESPKSTNDDTKDTFGGFPNPLGQNQKIDDSTYVWNWNIIHLRPVPSKNIEDWQRRSNLKFWISKRTNFTPTGIP